MADSDAEKAKRYRALLDAPLTEICRIFDEAKKDGLHVGFNVTPDQFGRSVAQIVISKPL